MKIGDTVDLSTSNPLSALPDRAGSGAVTAAEIRDGVPWYVVEFPWGTTEGPEECFYPASEDKA